MTAVTIAGCAYSMAEEAEPYQSTVTDFYVRLHIHSRDFLDIQVFALPNAVKKRAQAKPALTPFPWKEFGGGFMFGTYHYQSLAGLDQQSLRRGVLSYLLNNTGYGKRLVGGGAYIIVRDSWVKDDYVAEIHRFTAEQRRGTAPANPKQKSG